VQGDHGVYRTPLWPLLSKWRESHLYVITNINMKLRHIPHPYARVLDWHVVT
jgi:hypothetical protein